MVDSLHRISPRSIDQAEIASLSMKSVRYREGTAGIVSRDQILRRAQG